MSDSDDANVPSAEVCGNLIDQFVAITSTDEALGQMILQENDWNLEKAVNAFFNTSETLPKVFLNTSAQLPKDVVISSKPPDAISLMTWNIDGLDCKNLEARTNYICEFIENSKVSIVFLQEVVGPTWKMIKERLFNYFCLGDPKYDYFTGVLLRKLVVHLDDFQTIDYPGTRMGRNMFLVNCHVGKAKLCLINTHLESTKDHSEERKRQLQQCWKSVLNQSGDKTVIFGGDLNLRDSELTGMSVIPAGIDDLWIRTGSRKECQYTWDMTRNSNLEFPGKFRPRCRFDRLYIRDSTPRRLKPEMFGLEGIEKIARHQCFPSDHWAIRVDFTVDSE